MNRRASFHLLVTTLLLSCLLTVVQALGQKSPPGSPPSAKNAATSSIPTNTSVPEPTAGAGQVRVRTFLSDFEFWLSAEILVFGCVVIVFESWLLRKSRMSAEDTLRVYAVTLIIVGTFFTITAGFSADQVAPAMGLFGTIAGYLLGRRVSEKTPEQEERKT